jgi:hypothetical protein
LSTLWWSLDFLVTAVRLGCLSAPERVVSLASSRISMSKDEWWHCVACSKFTYCRESTSACKYCKAVPRGKTASWLQARKAAGASGSGGSSSAAKPWSTEEWATVTRHNKKNLRRTKSRAEAAAKSAAEPPTDVEVSNDDDVEMSTGDVDMAKELAEVEADLATFEAIKRTACPGRDDLKKFLVAERDRLKAALSSAKPPNTRLWAAKRQHEKHVALRDKAASSHVASLARMAKQLAEHEKFMQNERDQQEKFCEEMCAQEVHIAAQCAIVAEASQQMADKNANDAKLPTKEALLVGVHPPIVVTPGDDAGLARAAALQAHRALGLAMEQEHAKQSREFVAAVPPVAPPAVHAATEVSAQPAPPAAGGLQPSDAELAKQCPPAKNAGRASPYGPTG